MTRLPSGASTRWRLGAAALAAAAALTAGAAGCSDQPHLSGTCGVVVDGSQSGNAATGFDANRELTTHLGGFLQRAGCRYVVFGPINGASQASRCTQPTLDMDPPDQGNLPPQAVAQAARGEARRRAIKELDCAQSDPTSIPGGSDIVGGLARIAKALSSWPGPYHVLVVSDFISWDADLRLPNRELASAGGRSALLGQLAAKNLIPDLHGLHIVGVGFGILVSKNPAVPGEFSAFWNEFMARAHAASWQYGQ